MNPLGKFFACGVCFLIMFYYPMMYDFEKQDAMAQTYVTNEVTDFTDNIKNHGYISTDMYYRFIRKIDATGNLYNVEIIHSHQQVVPIYDENLVFQNKYDIYFIDTFEDEIFNTLEEGKNYLFSEGDRITVKVTNRNSTTASKLRNVFSFHNNENTGIVVVYGGMIRDEVD